MEEIWKTTERLNGFYEVSNLGRVRRVAPSKGATVGHILKAFIRNDYEYVPLNMQTKIVVAVHRLVCEAFHGTPIPGQVTHHKNSDKTCNCADNLEWTTSGENIKKSGWKIAAARRRHVA